MSEASTTIPTPTTQAVAEEDGHKVFVGNLSFQTTADELAELFSKPNPVLSVNIITRFPRAQRSAGYGFVAYETLAQAETAAATYHKAELGGRQINVEVAKPRTERGPREKAPRQPKSENKDATAGEASETAEFRPRTGRNSRKGSRKGNRNRAARQNEGEEGTTGEETPADNTAAAAAANGEAKEGAKDDKEGTRRRRRNNRRSPKEATRGDSSVEGNATSSARTRQTGPPSKNTIFVANLPFSMNPQGLKDLFSEFKVVKAHIVRRRPMRGGRSRPSNYGFVELENETEQLNALKLNDFEIDGRQLAVKIAHSEEQAPAKEQISANEQEEATDTDATSAPEVVA
ncbi:hypothetical protein BX616_011208 [Lobosporangium transversale]|uniref:RRM domain-containing protein n=1 Tax=Lobosporangium transversale TaxID=64571 RepID=A0A1Y2GIU7_9FUNG|nr:hypothetical protein BCR41DRAFT_356536 [Lobosporangium transversale]KAF9909383.1 hypothetical protein BX616_011208 [Lobosporangium transversale]ORZ12133.1 hypothetical protein BCR41DRAFT_356536 [Lobosporangium transversale]|eukprot:XP_021879998.1 hypothetical protein BCR41DRAFT_356536 [Lobosporangium transversale]